MIDDGTIQAVGLLANTFGFDATRLALTGNRRALADPAACELLGAQLPRHEPSSPEYRVIKARLRALEQCLASDTDSAFAAYEQAAQSILTLLGANTWDEIRTALSTGREHLLPPVADIAFADLVMQPSPEKESACILSAWDLVRLCRETDVDDAVGRCRASESNADKKEVRALRIGQSPDGQWRITPEEAGAVSLRPDAWLPILSPDSRGFAYLHGVHTGSEYDRYRPLAQVLGERCGHGSTRQVIEQHWNSLIAAEVREVLAHQLLCRKYELPTPRQRAVRARLDAIDRCVGDGTGSVFSGYDAAAHSVLSLLNADTWDQVQKIVETSRHRLLPEISDVAFADLVLQPSPDEQQHICGGWNLVARCRELGVEAAFEEHRRERRGTVLPASEASKLVSGDSPAELQQRLSTLQPLRRKQEGQAQAEAWHGFDEYLATMQELTAPADLPERIAASRAALGELDRDKAPLLWAVASLDLGDSLFTQAKEQSAPDVTEVISAYEGALAILSATGEPDQFGHAHHCLGDACLLNPKGDHAANTERAIEHYEAALGVRRRGVEPIPWATTQAHLGEALYRRSQGDRAITLDRAIDALEHAVEVLTATQEGALLGAAYVSLGAALRERITGSREENLNAAGSALDAALEVLDLSTDPKHLKVSVMAHANMGALLWTRAHSEPWDFSALLESAETHFRRALDRAGPQTDAVVQAQLSMGLGLTLSDRPAADSRLVADAIQHFENAIRLLEANPPAPPGMLELAHHNLAEIHAALESGDRTQNLTQAEGNYLAALNAFPANEMPVQRRDTLRAYGRTCFEDERWETASDVFREAMQISEEILGGSYTEAGKEAEASGNRNLYSHAVFCLLKLERFSEALETLESGKARMLTEALGWKDLDLSTLTPEDQQAFRWAKEQVIRLEAENRLPMSGRRPEEQSRQERQLADACRHLASLSSEALGVSMAGLDIDSLLAEIPANGALVAPVVTSKGGAAFVLPGGLNAVTSEHLVTLDSLTPATLGELMAGDAGLGGWLNTYSDWQAGAFQLSDGILQEELDNLTTVLWDILMDPIHDRLTELGVAEQGTVVIIPSGWLALFPLHAASRQVNGRRRSFGDDFTVSLAPSIRVLRLCRQRLAEPERKGTTLLAISNPTQDLRFAEAECTDLVGLFTEDRPSATPLVSLVGDVASRARVIRDLGGANYHHFSCHGRFDWTHPDASGLRLANDDWLRLPDILSAGVDLSSSRLVCLSACETGLSEFRDMPDEFVGLPGAFLEGGAPAVVSTLWPVDEVSTKLLMSEFYRLHLSGQSAAEALKAAQTFLRTCSAGELGLVKEYDRAFIASGKSDSLAKQRRDYYAEHPEELPFKHSFYWAAFTLTGAYEVRTT